MTMQRRLTLAFVGLAMAAIVLVGIGVLLMTQVGARSDARGRIANQLDTIVELANQNTDGNDVPRSLGRIGAAFEVDELQVVLVFADGRVTSIPDRGEQSDRALFSLDSEQQETFASGDPVELARGREVAGLQRVDVEIGNRPRGGNTSIGILIGENVSRIPREATAFFAASGAAVLLLALGAGWFLARRMSEPIRSIEEATTAIAAGDLSTRVHVSGRDEIAQLADSVNAMAADLDRSRALEQQFLLSVSHDLRTPLTAIGGYAEALIDGAVTDAPATGSIIASHADRLNRLVTDLLQLARLDANSFSIDTSTFDIVRAAEETVDGLAPSAERAGVSLEVQSPPGSIEVIADRQRTAQIMANLIENALKFAESAIVVTVGRSGERVTIAVIDDGPGIDDADLPHVFERLYVAKLQPKRAETSSGLGLAIVRELARAMNGSVTAGHNPSGGAIMTVELPAVG